MSGYLDDSYNNNTVVVGGWIAHDKTWNVIQNKWGERIAYEARMSAKRGLKPFTRYHASDCASRFGEFEGWTLERQIALTKPLVSIMTNHPPKLKPMLFAYGFSLWEAKETFKGMSPELALRDMYRYCVIQCLREIGTTMQKFYTNERITFIHDAGSNKSSDRKGTLFKPALEAYEFVKHNPSERGADQFVTFAPMGWETCIPLQPADMVAFDAFKTINQRLHKDPQAAMTGVNYFFALTTIISPDQRQLPFDSWAARSARRRAGGEARPRPGFCS